MQRGAVVLFLVLTACSADAVKSDTSKVDARIPDAFVLELDPAPSSTLWSSLPITGFGPKNGTLHYTTPAGGTFTAAIGASGEFCVDVFLMKNSTNTLIFEAIPKEGGFTNSVVVEIMQTGDAPIITPPPIVPGYSNIVAGAVLSSMSITFEKGNAAALVDGDSTAAVSIRNDLNEPDWIVLELNERLAIQQIHIETALDCPLESFRVHLNDLPQSDGLTFFAGVDGFLYTEGWNQIAFVENGTTDEWIIPSVGDPKAQRIAIEFISNDCGPFIGAGRHRITEIEVWARGNEQPVPPAPNAGPSCNAL